MKITLIAAMDGMGGIGKNGAMPWYCNEDLKHFKAYTADKVVVMGRKTWDSLLLRPLPRRKNFVITGNGSKDHLQSIMSAGADGVFYGGDIDYKGIFELEESEICIIGGGSIYSQFLPHATHMVLTKTDLGIDYECDTFFPDFDESKWICTETKGLCDLVWVEYLERKQ